MIEDEIKIAICYYQPWELPKEKMFFPIQAGKAISPFDLKMQGDNTGDNISEKNATFSEFTAWYWVWKNIKKIYPSIKYIGLSHYRRFFAFDLEPLQYVYVYKDKIPIMANYDELIKKTLLDNDIILSKPEYFGMSVKEQYCHYHYESDILIIRDIVKALYPAYINTFDFIFNNDSGISLYCMMICRYELLDSYFQWLFPILFEAEKRIDVSERDKGQKRAFAFIAERLLNVYIKYNDFKVAYRPVFFIKGEKIMKNLIKNCVPYGILKLFKWKWRKND